MDSLFVLGPVSLGIIVAGIFLPQIITTLVMSSKGYSGCLWFLLSFFLSWIGVIIAICMPNKKRQEEQHQEMIAAINSQNHSETIVINKSEKNNMPENNFRIKAISNLKATGTPFDEYDVELEIEKVKKEHENFLIQEAAEQKRIQQEEKARFEEEEKIIRKQNAKIILVIAGILIFMVLAVIFYLISIK